MRKTKTRARRLATVLALGLSILFLSFPALAAEAGDLVVPGGEGSPVIENVEEPTAPVEEAGPDTSVPEATQEEADPTADGTAGENAAQNTDGPGQGGNSSEVDTEETTTGEEEDEDGLAAAADLLLDGLEPFGLPPDDAQIITTYGELKTAVDGLASGDDISLRLGGSIEITDDYLPVPAGAKLSLYGGTLTRPQGQDGYHFRVEGELQLHDIVLDGGYSTPETKVANGIGGVQVYGGTLILEDAQIIHCMAFDYSLTSDRPAIYGENAAVELRGASKVNNNTAAGGLAASGIWGVTSQSNCAAIKLTGSSSLLMRDDAEVAENYILGKMSTSGTSQGIGVQVAGSFTMKGNSAVRDNRIYSFQNGVGVGAQGGGQGGGVYISGSMEMEDNSRVSGNYIYSAGMQATSSGGGVYVGSNGSLTINGNAKVEGNSIEHIDQRINSIYGGGVALGANAALYLNGNSAVEDNALLLATAGSSDQNTKEAGGGIVAMAGSLIKIEDAAAVRNNNGCVRPMQNLSVASGIYSEGTVEMDGGFVEGNGLASSGGIHMYGAGELYITGGVIRGNYTMPGTGATYQGNGGGVFTEGTAAVEMSGGVITGNACGSGAGVGLSGTASFVMSGEASITENLQGSGLYLAQKSVAEMWDESSITKNEGGGAAIYGSAVVGPARLTMNDEASISGQEVDGTGGGVYIHTGLGVALAMYGDSEIAHNHASTNGGGIFSQYGSTVEMHDNSSLHHNTSGQEGGAYYGSGMATSSKVRFSMFDDSSLHHNEAQGTGGAVFTRYAGVITLDSPDVALYNNTSANHGGAIGVQSSSDTIVVNGSQLYNNTAAVNGGAIYNADTVSYANLTIANSARFWNNNSEAGAYFFDDTVASHVAAHLARVDVDELTHPFKATSADGYINKAYNNHDIAYVSMYPVRSLTAPVVEKTANVAPHVTGKKYVDNGDTFSYTIKVTNPSGWAQDVTLTDTLPVGLTLQGSDVAPTSQTGGGTAATVLTWDLALPANGYREITLTVEVGPAALAPWADELVNKAETTYDNRANGGSAADAGGSDTESVFITTPPGHSITYLPGEAQSGAVPVDGNIYYPGDEIVLAANTGGLAKTGHTYVGWKDSGGTLHAVGDSLTMHTAPLTVTAEFAVNTYRLTLRYNDGSNLPSAKNYTYGATLDVPGTPTRSGYRFTGWVETRGGQQTAWDFATNRTMPDRDVTLDATWERVETTTPPSTVPPSTSAPVSTPSSAPTSTPVVEPGSEVSSVTSGVPAASERTTTSQRTGTPSQAPGTASPPAVVPVASAVPVSSSVSSASSAAAPSAAAGAEAPAPSKAPEETRPEPSAPEVVPEDEPVELEEERQEGASLNLFGNEVPLGGLADGSGWSLLNLAISLLAALWATLLCVLALLRQRAPRPADDAPNQEGERPEKQRKGHWASLILQTLTGFLPLVCFLALENFTRMLLLSRWTPLVLLLAVGHAAICLWRFALQKATDRQAAEEEG